MGIDPIKVAGYVAYAVGIVGCVEGVLKESVPISLVAMVVVVIGSVLLGMKKKRKQ